MDLGLYRPAQAEEIKGLFRRVFSDSEGQDEGVLIGDLAYALMAETEAEDLYGFVAIEDKNCSR